MNNEPIISFPTPSPENMGGCRGFMYVESDKVVDIPLIRGRYLRHEPTLSEGAEWLAGYATEKTLAFNEKMEENDSGEHFLTEISGFYPKMDHETLSLFSRMRHRRFVVIVTDNNGFNRLCGSKENPLEFRFNQGSGEVTTERNGYRFLFRGHQRKESPFYNVDATKTPLL